jgi:hypothetical protein
VLYDSIEPWRWRLVVFSDLSRTLIRSDRRYLSNDLFFRFGIHADCDVHPESMSVVGPSRHEADRDLPACEEKQTLLCTGAEGLGVEGISLNRPGCRRLLLIF